MSKPDKDKSSRARPKCMAAYPGLVGYASGKLFCNDWQREHMRKWVWDRITALCGGPNTPELRELASVATEL